MITLSSTLILGISRGHDGDVWLAVAAALSSAAAIGLLNGLLVAVLQLNALIVTLAVGAITSGITLWYRESLPAKSRVPPAMAAWGGSRILGLSVSVWVAAILVIALTLVLRKSVIGRRFVAVGANPRAAWVAGINVSLYQTVAFIVAALLYGITGILLSAFIRNPTLKVGDPYCLRRSRRRCSAVQRSAVASAAWWRSPGPLCSLPNLDSRSRCWGCPPRSNLSSMARPSRLPWR